MTHVYMADLCIQPLGEILNNMIMPIEKKAGVVRYNIDLMNS